MDLLMPLGQLQFKLCVAHKILNHNVYSTTATTTNNNATSLSVRSITTILTNIKMSQLNNCSVVGRYII